MTNLVEGTEPVIKDSGDRTKFESGAVRDMRKGKGRFDVAPLDVVGRMLRKSERDEPNYTLINIARFMRDNDTKWLYTAMRFFFDEVAEGCYSFEKTACTMLLEVAVHFEEGAEKYGEMNWQLGIPAKCYIDSAVRHYIKWRRGDVDERHDRAFLWNLMCCIWEVDFREKETPDDES